MPLKLRPTGLGPAEAPGSRAHRAFILVAMSEVRPGLCPLSTSAFFTHSLSVCGVQPILAAIDTTAAQCRRLAAG
jgi:hypothetical protein